LNYATTKKELLVEVFAFEKFRSYIVNSKVIIFTDEDHVWFEDWWMVASLCDE
jgi:hypothetical protein